MQMFDWCSTPRLPLTLLSCRTLLHAAPAIWMLGESQGLALATVMAAAAVTGIRSRPQHAVMTANPASAAESLMSLQLRHLCPCL